jgi:hypothetical protein
MHCARDELTRMSDAICWGGFEVGAQWEKKVEEGKQQKQSLGSSTRSESQMLRVVYINGFQTVEKPPQLLGRVFNRFSRRVSRKMMVFHPTAFVSAFGRDFRSVLEGLFRFHMLALLELEDAS